jgi:hypothetical protein
VGFATKCRWDGVEFVSRKNGGNEYVGANAGMAAGWADSFPAPPDTPIVPQLPPADSVAKPHFRRTCTLIADGYLG